MKRKTENEIKHEKKNKQRKNIHSLLLRVYICNSYVLTVDSHCDSLHQAQRLRDNDMVLVKLHGAQCTIAQYTVRYLLWMYLKLKGNKYVTNARQQHIDPMLTFSLWNSLNNPVACILLFQYIQLSARLKKRNARIFLFVRESSTY